VAKVILLSMLIQAQLERQDFVDNAIFSLLEELKTSNAALVWDIEMIGEIRNIIQHWLKDKNLTQPQAFYPSVET
jgi:hypothetical protein